MRFLLVISSALLVSVLSGCGLTRGSGSYDLACEGCGSMAVDCACKPKAPDPCEGKACKKTCYKWVTEEVEVDCPTVVWKERPRTIEYTDWEERQKQIPCVTYRVVEEMQDYECSELYWADVPAKCKRNVWVTEEFTDYEKVRKQLVEKKTRQVAKTVPACEYKSCTRTIQCASCDPCEKPERMIQVTEIPTRATKTVWVDQPYEEVKCFSERVPVKRVRKVLRTATCHTTKKVQKSRPVTKQRLVRKKVPITIMKTVTEKVPVKKTKTVIERYQVKTTKKVKKLIKKRVKVDCCPTKTDCVRCEPESICTDCNDGC